MRQSDRQRTACDMATRSLSGQPRGYLEAGPYARDRGGKATEPGSMSSTKLSKDEYEKLAEFRLGLRRFLDFSERAAKEMGLTPRQHQALLSIRGFPGKDSITIGELADHLLIRHHSAVELCDRLEALGLVQRSTDPQDGRRILLTLTPAAEAILTRMSAIHLEELRRIGPRLAGLLKAFG